MKIEIVDRILYEDNHIIAVNKLPSEIVQSDKTGDRSLMEDIKAYLKEKYNKPGKVYLGLVQRLDRPVGGVIVYAKTSKAAARLSEMIKHDKITKIYLAITYNKPKPLQGTLKQYLYKNANQNKSYVTTNKDTKGAKEALLHYKYIKSSERYNLIEVELVSGRHHQIRCQLASIGCVIKGDLKYGAKRSNSDKSISLWSHKIIFTHPIKKEKTTIIAPPYFDIPII